jgi:hypothetical protein
MYWARSGTSSLHQLLGGDDERDLVGVAGHPVDPVEQRRDLGVVADLGQLLVAAVHVPDHRLDVVGALAVDLGHQAEHPVGGRVLRPDVEGHVLGLEFDRDRGLGQVADEILIGDRHLASCLRVLGRRSVVGGLGVVVVVARLRHRLDVDLARPRLHLAAEQRVGLAQRDGRRSRWAGRAAQSPGCPSKTIPNMSWASRSCQSAPGKTVDEAVHRGDRGSRSVDKVTRGPPRGQTDRAEQLVPLLDLLAERIAHRHLVRPVDGAQPGEEDEPEVGRGASGPIPSTGRRDGHLDGPEGDVSQSRPRPRPPRRRTLERDRPRRPPPRPRSRPRSVSDGLMVTLVPLLPDVLAWIFFCRRRMPSSSASGRGGQPGT